MPSSLTYSCFVPNSNMAVTATGDGDLIVWNNRSLNNMSEKLPKGVKAATKFVRLHHSRIIFVNSLNGKYLVTGGEDGQVKVYDLQFRLVSWFDKLAAGPITSVSFFNPTSKLENNFCKWLPLRIQNG